MRRRPDTANAQLGYTPLPVHIQDSNSQLFVRYNPNSAYQVVVDRYSSTQQWYVFQNDHFPEYYVIANSTATDPYTRVIAADYGANTPLYLEPLNTESNIKLNQLWTFDLYNDKYFIITSPYSGKVMTVYDSETTPGTRVTVYFRKNIPSQMFYFRN